MSELKKQSGGFSAVELLVIIVLLSIVFSAFVSGYNLITQANKKSQNINVVSNLAYSKLQEYKNMPYDTIGSETATGETTLVENFSNQFPSSFIAPRDATVSVSNPSDNLKQIIVRVTYGQGDNPRTISFSDFIRRSD
jgi:type II secretory pathway pseudopilin PulG